MLHSIALVAGIAMALAIFPQAYKIFKDKSAQDVSVITFAVLTIGSFIWIIYGVDRHDSPIISSYIVRFIASVLVLSLIFYYASRPPGPR